MTEYGGIESTRAGAAEAAAAAMAVSGVKSETKNLEEAAESAWCS